MHKSDLYEFFQLELKEMDNSDEEIPSIETFLFTWRNDFSHLKIPRHNTLGTCDTCHQLKTVRNSLKRNTVEFNNIRNLLSHLSQVRQERVAQTIRDQTSNSYPTQSWTVITV